jgi:hypothetical protein
MFGFREHPPVWASTDLAIPGQSWYVDQHVFRERVHIQENVAAAISTEPAMSGRLGVEVADLLLALGDLGRIALHHGDDI